MNDILIRIFVFLIEVGIGLVSGTVAAAFILPLAYTERGYFAVGGEWFIIVIVAYAGFTAANRYIFNKIERS